MKKAMLALTLAALTLLTLNAFAVDAPRTETAAVAADTATEAAPAEGAEALPDDLFLGAEDRATGACCRAECWEQYAACQDTCVGYDPVCENACRTAKNNCVNQC